MPLISSAPSTLLVVDFQARLMPAIDGGAAAVANARRLIDAAGLLDVPVLFTEQNPRGLGTTVEDLAPAPGAALHKMTFNAVATPAIAGRIPPGAVVVAGCEAHVCVLQTVLGLREQGRPVFVVADAIGSRRPENKAVAIDRMARHGADVVTTEMVVFEWLGTAEHLRFRDVVALIK